MNAASVIAPIFCSSRNRGLLFLVCRQEVDKRTTEIGLMENSVQSWQRSLVFCPSLNPLIRSIQHRLRNCHADLLGHLEINHQLELSRLLHGQIGRLGSLQYLVHLICDAPVAVRLVRPVRHEPTGIYIRGRLPRVYHLLADLSPTDFPKALKRTSSG